MIGVPRRDSRAKWGRQHGGAFGLGGGGQFSPEPLPQIFTGKLHPAIKLAL